MVQTKWDERNTPVLYHTVFVFDWTQFKEYVCLFTDLLCFFADLNLQWRHLYIYIYLLYIFFLHIRDIFTPSILPSFKHSIIQSLSQSFCSVIHLVYLQSICKHVVSYLPVQLLMWHCGITATATAIKHRSYLFSMSNQIDVIATMPGEPCSKNCRWIGWGRTTPNMLQIHDQLCIRNW